MGVHSIKDFIQIYNIYKFLKKNIFKNIKVLNPNLPDIPSQNEDGKN